MCLTEASLRAEGEGLGTMGRPVLERRGLHHIAFHDYTEDFLSQCPVLGRRVCTLLLIVAILSTFSVSMPRDGAQGLHHK